MPGKHRSSRGPFRSVWLLILFGLVTGGVLVVRLTPLLDGGEATRAAPVSSPPAVAATPSPSLADSPSPEPEPRGRILIHGTGDVNVDPSYIPNFRTYGYGYAWSGLDGLFRRDDLTVINLECAVSDKGTAVAKEFNFRGDPAALPAMRRAGVEVANLGNNHSYDFGPEALVDTRKNVERAGISAIGAGRDRREALSPALFELNGWTVAVVGIDHVVDPYPEAVAAPGKPGTAAGHDVEQMVRAIRRADREADIVVVSIHWGIELDTQPRDFQVDMGHRFVDGGADIIFGHHSHRLQPLSFYKGRPIFWGLGNFVWPNFSIEGSTTAVAEVAVTPDGDFTARLLPAFIESAGHPVMRG